MYRQTMDKKPYIYIEKRKTNKNKKSKPSKVLMGFALIIAFSLPYFLVKKFSHNTHQGSTTQSISLPDVDGDDSEEYQDETYQENAYQNVEEEIAEESKPELAKETAKTVVASAIKTIKPVKNIVKDNEWQTIKPRSGDSMATIFKRLGLTAQNLHLVMQKNPYAKALTAIKPSQELRFLINKNKLFQ